MCIFSCDDCGGIDIRTYEKKCVEYKDTIETLIDVIANQCTTSVRCGIHQNVINEYINNHYPYIALKPDIRDRILRRFHAILNEEN